MGRQAAGDAVSIEVMVAVFEVQLPASEKFVLLALANYADPFGVSIYPSVATISRQTSMSERTVQRLMARLRERRVLQIVRPVSDLGTVEYRIVLEGLAKQPKPDYRRVPSGLRQELIEAFKRTCSYCGRVGSAEVGPDGTTWTIDRIVPGSRGGQYVPMNVTLACRSCNTRKSDGDAKVAPPTLADVVTARGATDAVEWGAKSGDPGVPPLAPNPSSKDNPQESPRGKNRPPPAVEAYREGAHRYPNKALWARIAENVGEGAGALKAWQELVVEWIARGWNPANIAGMLQAWQAGGLTSGKVGQEPRGFGAIRQAMQEDKP